MEKTRLLNLTAEDWFEKGQQLAREGCHGEAIEAFNRAIAEVPAYAEAYFARGACYYGLGSYHQAADDIDAAAILGCRDAQFWSRFDTNSYSQRAEDEDEQGGVELKSVQGLISPHDSGRPCSAERGQ